MIGLFILNIQVIQIRHAVAAVADICQALFVRCAPRSVPGPTGSRQKQKHTTGGAGCQPEIMRTTVNTLMKDTFQSPQWSKCRCERRLSERAASAFRSGDLGVSFACLRCTYCSRLEEEEERRKEEEEERERQRLEEELARQEQERLHQLEQK